MAKQDNKIEFLNVALDINTRVNTSIERCESLINNPDIPDAVKLWFLEMQTALKMQQMLCSKLMESQFDVEDQIENLLTKYAPDKK